MRIAVGVDGGQGHGVGFDRQALGLHRVVEPLAEQAEGIARGVGLAEAIAGVLAAHIGQGLGHWRISREMRHKLNRRLRLALDPGQWRQAPCPGSAQLPWARDSRLARWV